MCVFMYKLQTICFYIAIQIYFIVVVVVLRFHCFFSKQAVIFFVLLSKHDNMGTISRKAWINFALRDNLVGFSYTNDDSVQSNIAIDVVGTTSNSIWKKSVKLSINLG